MIITLTNTEIKKLMDNTRRRVSSIEFELLSITDYNAAPIDDKYIMTEFANVIQKLDAIQSSIIKG